MLEDFRSHRGIAPLTTGFDYPVFLETISLLQFRHPKARGVQSTKSVGQALRVSLVKPGAYLSASYGYVIHNLILTRTMIAAALWAKDHPSFSLTDKRICYELSGKVVPDCWLRFEQQADDGRYVHPIIFEIDRGMENKDQFRAHARGRINYLQSGEYKKTFDTEYATIVYATTGQTPAYCLTRRKNLCSWIMQLLKEMRLEAWAGVFRVASIEFGSLYDNALFEGEVWHRPDSEKAVRLFE